MRSWRKSLILSAHLLLGVMALQGCGSEGLPQLSASAPAEYHAGPGDKLHISVQDLTAADADYEVDDSGSVSLPMVKSIRVEGLTFREIESAVEAAYLQAGILNQPVVNVQAIELRPFYVMGEVNQPGEFKYRQGMTVLAALSAAGGYTYRAKTGEVAITRTTQGQEVTTRADENAYVLPGDRIRVFERWF